MKRYFISLLVFFISATIISFPSQAKETFAEKCQRLQRESDAEFVAGLEKDGNLTQEAIDAFHLQGKQPQKKLSKTITSGNTASTSIYTGEARGWIYGVDELHVTGLPEDPQSGYTKPGNYGTIPK